MGLQAEDTELGIEQVWLFAHPANKAMTGPLARFRTLFASPAYAPLLGHQAHAIAGWMKPRIMCALLCGCWRRTG